MLPGTELEGALQYTSKGKKSKKKPPSQSGDEMLHRNLEKMRKISFSGL